MLYLAEGGPWLFFAGLIGVLYVMYGWWSEVVHEGQTGDHTPVVRIGLRYGFVPFLFAAIYIWGG